MPSPWNDAVDCQLLLIMLHLTSAPLPKWDKVAELMGEGYTKEAVRQHFQKLRKDTTTRFGALGDAAGVGSPAPKATPKGKGKGVNGASAVKPTGVDGKRKAVAVVDGEDDEEGSPSKKMVIKHEGGGERVSDGFD